MLKQLITAFSPEMVNKWLMLIRQLPPNDDANVASAQE